MLDAMHPVKHILDDMHKKIVKSLAMAKKKKEKNEAAAALGRLGGPARAKALSKERRAEIARTAAQVRWAEKKPDQR